MDLEKFQTDNLIQIKRVLADNNTPPFDRLCSALCVFLHGLAELEMEERLKKVKSKPGK